MTSRAQVIDDRSRPGSGKLDRDARTRRGFLLPGTVVVLLLSIFPLVFSIAVSLTNWNLFAGHPLFVGAGEWLNVLSDGEFWTAAANTLFYVVVGALVEYGIGLSLAILVRQVQRGRRFFRVIFLIPMMMSPVAVGFIIGRMLFNETGGPIEDLGHHLGLNIHWVSSVAVAPWTIIITDAWQWTPFMFLFLLAGLDSMPEEPLEAAVVDGASAWQRFRYVTFPMLAPITVTIILIRGLELLKLVDIVRVITGGGPGEATETVTYYVYSLALQRGDMGYGSAVALAMLILAMVGALIYVSLSRLLLERWT